LGAILSAAMMLRYSFKLPNEADCLERSVKSVLAAGYRSADIAGSSGSAASTAEMGAKVVARIEQEAAVSEPVAAH
jgi:3-isopropylmalate dehydrogenase